jgi:hypothetical protein
MHGHLQVRDPGRAGASGTPDGQKACDIAGDVIEEGAFLAAALTG